MKPAVGCGDVTKYDVTHNKCCHLAGDGEFIIGTRDGSRT